MIRHLYILTLLFSSIAIGQDYVEAAISSTKASTVEPITYQISTSCDCDIQPPDLSGFDILQETPGKFTQSSNVNGVQTNECTSTLTFVLRPKKKGTIEIGKAKAICANSKKTSKTFSVNVVDADELHAQGEGVSAFYYKLESNKKQVYVGEPFTLTMYLYCEKLPEDINNIVRGDALGLTRNKLYNEREPGHKFPQFKERVKGKDYHVIELSKEVCFADAAGTLKIAPYYGSAVEQYRMWDNLYMEGYSNSIEIKVKEIPGEKPEIYYGMSGQFEMTHEISETTVKANHAIDMKVTISGEGNFHLLNNPDFLFPKDSFLVSGPEIEQDLVVTENGQKGSITYSYVITPTQQGEYLILPYSFAYFDWASRQMKVVSTHDFIMHVEKGSDVRIYSEHGGDGQDVEDDIRYIHTKSDRFFEYGDLWFGKLIYIGLIGVGPIFFFIFVIIKRRRSNKSADDIKVEAQKETKRSTVKDIKKLQSLDPEQGIKGLKSSLEDYFMTHFDMGRSVLTKGGIKSRLKEKSIDETTISSFEKIWDQIEMARYAPMSDQNVSELYTQTEKLIASLNKQL